MYSEFGLTNSELCFKKTTMGLTFKAFYSEDYESFFLNIAGNSDEKLCLGITLLNSSRSLLTWTVNGLKVTSG